MEEVFMKVGEAKEEEDSSKHPAKGDEFETKDLKDGKSAQFRVFTRDGKLPIIMTISIFTPFPASSTTLYSVIKIGFTVRILVHPTIAKL